MRVSATLLVKTTQLMQEFQIPEKKKSKEKITTARKINFHNLFNVVKGPLGIKQ